MLLLAAGCAMPLSPTRFFDLEEADAALAQMADRHYECLAELLEVYPARAIIDVYPDRASFTLAYPHAAAAEGLYLPGAPARIAVFHPVDSGTLRHEIAHHFIYCIAGGRNPVFNEGFAEALERSARRGGYPVLMPALDHLDALLRREEASFHEDAIMHRHADYASAWARASIVLRTSTTWTEAIHSTSHLPPPDRDQVLSLARAWREEIRAALADEDPRNQVLAARILGRLADVDALNAAVGHPRPLFVQAAIAGALATLGEKEPLKRLLPRLHCECAVRQISLAAGRVFESLDEVRSWAEAP